MANQDHLDLLKQSVESWNAWKITHPAALDLTEANLSKSELAGADLRGANLSRADLNRADLRGANLSRADLRQADLRGANLSDAKLRRADLRDAHLSFAKLSRAHLTEAKLNGADLSSANLGFALLSGANLSSARMWETIIAGVDLRTTRGLSEIRHEGPSILQSHTIQLPQDGTALHFLRGAGVPDAWIALYQAETMHPVQYHSLFISYSSKDEIVAHRLHADLQDLGVRCWFAPEDLKIGTKLRQRIDEAIHLQDKLLLLLSEHSIASTWVEHEVEAALEKEDREQREVLFPIRLDDAVMQTSQAWAATLRRTRHIGDFTDWTEPQAYQRAFDRLLRDLKQG